MLFVEEARKWIQEQMVPFNLAMEMLDDIRIHSCLTTKLFFLPDLRVLMDLQFILMLGPEHFADYNQRHRLLSRHKIHRILINLYYDTRDPH